MWQAQNPEGLDENFCPGLSQAAASPPKRRAWSLGRNLKEAWGGGVDGAEIHPCFAEHYSYFWLLLPTFGSSQLLVNIKKVNMIFKFQSWRQKMQSSIFTNSSTL